MPFILGANETKVTGFNVANSVRFNSADNAYMGKTSGANGTSTSGTFSCWLKRGNLGVTSSIMSQVEDANNFLILRFTSGDALDLRWSDAGSGTDANLTTTQVFRDCSSWINIVVKFLTSDSTEANRVKIYVNGTQVTSFSSSDYPTQNDPLYGNVSSGVYRIGDNGFAATGEDFDGYMAEVVWLDGTSTTASDFGEFNEDSPRIWQPVDVSGLSFGTNGFYLDFEDSSNLGNDANGGTDLTEVNLAAIDQTTDTCTNNFCTCNPLDQTNTGGSSATMAEGNLKWTSAGNTTSQSYMRATFGLTAGKWYWEAKMSDSNSGPGFQFGVSGANANMNQGGSGSMNDSDPNTHFVNAASTASATRKDGSNVTTSLTTVAENQIVQIALDLDNQKFYVGVQGTWLNSADPATGSNPPATVDANTTYLPAWSDNGYTDQITLELNFGNPSFTGTDKSDGNGYGSFEYEPPSGYLSLCSKNLGSDGG